MEPAQAKPIKKRRRSLIVTFVLVSLVSWWFWPRGDARFVGRWMITENVSPPNVDDIQFHSNSIAEMPGSAFWWRVVGDRMFCGGLDRNVMSRTQNFVFAAYWKYRGKVWASTEFELQIMDISKERIELRRLEDDVRLILHRVQE